MKTLSPSSHFMRVADKFFGSYIFQDSEVRQGPALLYLTLFFLCRHKDHCWPSQSTLAHMCKCSERSIQLYLQQLVELQYIRIERHNGHNVYRLLLSERVQFLLSCAEGPMQCCALPADPVQPVAAQVPRQVAIPMAEGTSPTEAGEDFSPTEAQNLRGEGEDSAGGENSSPENSAPDIRIYKNNLPPTPLPSRPIPVQTGAVASPSASGRGDFFSCPQEGKRQVHAKGRATAHLEAFARLYAVWPVKKDQDRALRIFCSLARAGQLPTLEDLLATVQRFALEDRHWRNGCAPLLSNWLRDRRWRDEPLPPLHTAPAFSSGVQPAFSPSPASATPAPAPVPAQAVPSLTPLPPVPTSPLEPAMKEAAQALSVLWPSVSRVKVMASLGLARVRGLSFQQLVEQARASMHNVASPRPSSEFSDWLHGVLA